MVDMGDLSLECVDEGAFILELIVVIGFGFATGFSTATRRGGISSYGSGKS